MPARRIYRAVTACPSHAHDQDLEAKFNQTAQYVNMKKMLETKNQQLQELRAAAAAGRS